MDTVFYLLLYFAWALQLGFWSVFSLLVENYHITYSTGLICSIWVYFDLKKHTKERLLIWVPCVALAVIPNLLFYLILKHKKNLRTSVQTFILILSLYSVYFFSKKQFEAHYLYPKARRAAESKELLRKENLARLPELKYSMYEYFEETLTLCEEWVFKEDQLALLNSCAHAKYPRRCVLREEAACSRVGAYKHCAVKNDTLFNYRVGIVFYQKNHKKYDEINEANCRYFQKVDAEIVPKDSM